MVAFDPDERTAKGRLARPGAHAEQAHEQFVEQARDFGPMQADEIRAKLPNCALSYGMVNPLWACISPLPGQMVKGCGPDHAEADPH